MADFPHASTRAAGMLAEGLRSASNERGLSLRMIGKKLGYRQAVVLSHMANGRVPIPLDRALDIAREVGLPAKHFLEAVLEQRHPTVEWGLLTSPGDQFALELETLAGKPLSSVGADYQRVLREVVRDPDPDARWLAIPEISAVELLRELFPSLRTEGISSSDREMLRTYAQFLDPKQEEKT